MQVRYCVIVDFRRQSLFILRNSWTEHFFLCSFQDQVPEKPLDPFYETQENHNLIGVANVFLEALFHDVKLDYHTPIISQQGEVAGRLQVRQKQCLLLGV